MNLQDLLRELDIPCFDGVGHRHSRDGWVQLDCPFCGPGSGKYHLGFNKRSRYFHCWHCGPQRADYVLSELGASRKLLQALFAEWKDEAPELTPRQTAAGRLKEPRGIAPMLGAHRRYLRGRGFDPEELERLWGLLGLAVVAGNLRWRVYIPITHRGRRVSWTARAIGQQVRPRYLSASPEQEEIPHKSMLYGLDWCVHSVVVVEGPADAWRVGPGAAAVFGTSYTTGQMRWLARIPNRYICFDHSVEAQSRADKLAMDLSAFPGRTQRIELDAEDPGSASRREIRVLRKTTGLDDY